MRWRKAGGCLTLLLPLHGALVHVTCTVLLVTAVYLLQTWCVCRNSFFSFCTYKSGYAGVATFCREQTAQPLAAEEGMTGTVPMQNSHASGAAQHRIHFSPFDTFWNRCAASLVPLSSIKPIIWYLGNCN